MGISTSTPFCALATEPAETSMVAAVADPFATVICVLLNRKVAATLSADVPAT